MRQNALLRLAIIGCSTLLFLIPLELINGVVRERRSFRDTARADIALSWSGDQTFTGPIIELEYKQRELITHYNPALKAEVARERWQQKTTHFVPETLKISSKLNTEERYRGIYSFPVYAADLQVSGTFVLPQHAELEGDWSEYKIGRARMLVGVSDIRGINNQPQLTWHEAAVSFQPGADGKLLPQGINAELAIGDFEQSREYPFSFKLNLRGMDELRFSPLGKITEIDTEAPWQHPKFIGSFLPDGRTISPTGFRATWRTTHFATNTPQLVRECWERNSCYAFNSSTLGVSLFDPVNVYLKTERSLKYGILFVGLTFLAAFLFEVLRRLRIHPIQYFLIGAALGIFYLLLISLSEHIPFGYAYLLGSAACSLLLYAYFKSVLNHRVWALAFTSGIATLYAVLYVLLESEDHALLTGAVMLFAILAAVMMLTRNIDWYDLSYSPARPSRLDSEEEVL